ncbi:putative Phage tail protein [Exiguobacterium sp. 8H]|uniref:phage tail domain-containing protein n=1 Tax=unclassified Exiguobacterium TaxID=2644629 RepID=UPI0012F11DB0|nr:MULTISPECIES: phage tail domain-containing protein [unclassified Exiguobacterium]VXB51307.1 putative Phage tail protein [Exiguobacterium sp. 8A]VXB52174.1 putative Phage tail protein [Exiguobacterium sp. 8H]
MIEFEFLDGTKTNTDEFGLTVKEFEVEPLTLRHRFEQIEMLEGNIPMGSTHEQRRIMMSARLFLDDPNEFPLYRDWIQGVFARLQPCYITDPRQPFKRWLVIPEGTPEYEHRNYGRVVYVTLNWVTYGLPYAEAITTTLTPYEWGQGYFWGAGLEWGENQYSFSNTNRFIINNFGNVELDPRKHKEFRIVYKGASDGLTITNLTNQEVFVYNGVSGVDDEIVLDRIFTTKNGLNIVRDTNRRVITLAAGANEFILAGTSSPFEISFEFRPLFY